MYSNVSGERPGRELFQQGEVCRVEREAATFRIDEARERNLIGRMLADARAAAGLSLTELAGMLAPYGLAITKSGLSRWERGERTPTAYQMLALCRVLRIRNPLDMYAEDLNDAGLRLLAAYRDRLAASGRYRPDTIELVDVRLYDVAVSAGTGSFLDSADYELLRVPAATVPAGTDYALRVSGSSMEPVYRDGQLVWVQEAERLRPGEVGVFSLDGESFLKLYQERDPDEADAEAYIDAENVLHRQPVLISFNPAYAPRVVRPDNYFRVLGRVLR